MAQVNSEPGKNQVAGNVTVAAGPNQQGSSAQRSISTLTTVAYSQSETGRHGEDKRS